MSTDDYRINAAIRNTLVRFWIDTSRLDHGSVNGVVYLRGRIHKELLRPEEVDRETENLAFMLKRLERELRNIRGVRDVVCNLDNLMKVRGRWVTRKAG